MYLDKSEPSIRVMIVDDHKILTESMATLINDQTDMTVVQKAHSGKETMAFFEKNKSKVDLVILDLQMEDTEDNELAGFKVAKYIRENVFVRDSNEIFILIMSQHTEGYRIDIAHKTGIHGFLPKDCESQELFDAIRSIVRNKRRYYRGQILEEWDDFLYQTEREKHTIPSLTSTENKILQMIAQGLTTKEIADIRNRGIDGIEAHRRNLMRKFNANNAPHMIALAYKWGMIKEGLD